MTVGPGDPLKDWTHKCRALAGGFGMQQPVVDPMCLGLQFGQVGQQPVAAQVPGVVDDGFDAQRGAVFEVLLDPGVAKAHGWSSPPLRVRGGVRDPLEDWIRKDAGLAGTFSLQQPGVDGTCLSLKFV